MTYNKEDIAAMEQRFRTAFINSLAGFRQAVLVGTKSAEGHTNLAIFNSLIHLGAQPALFGLISRPDTVPRDTLQNILATKEYTLNYVKAEHYEKAHHTSARYDQGVSEFEKAGFRKEYLPTVYPPFVEGAEVKIGMTLEETIPIPINKTILIIGSIQHVDIKEPIVAADGYVALADAGVLISQGLDAYFTTQSIGRLPYAKPKG